MNLFSDLRQPISDFCYSTLPTPAESVDLPGTQSYPSKMNSIRETLQLRDGGVVSLVGGGGKTTLMFQLAGEFASAGQSVLTTTTTRIFKPSPDLCPLIYVTANVPEMLEQLAGAETDPSCVHPSGGLHVTAACSELFDENKLVGYAPEQIDALQRTGFFHWIIVEADGARQRPLKAPAAHEPVIPESSRWVIAVIGLDAVGKPLDDRYVFRSSDYSKLTGVTAGAPVTTESVVRAVLSPSGIFKGFPPGAGRIVLLNKAEGPDRRAAGGEIARSLLERSNGGIHRVVVGSLLPELLVVESLP